MTVTNEMLAAYAEGKVFGAERDAIRKYLADNPSELKSVLMMMDEDYDLEADDMTKVSINSVCESCSSPFPNIALSAAAFAPQGNNIRSSRIRINQKQRKSFESNLNDLLDDIL